MDRIFKLILFLVSRKNKGINKNRAIFVTAYDTVKAQSIMAIMIQNMTSLYLIKYVKLIFMFH